MRNAILAVSLLMVAACGFKPIYATPEGASAPVNRQIAVGSVSAPQEAHGYLVDALRNRLSPAEDEKTLYRLSVVANERAQRLAVQIDATVTRYNYRLSGRYTLVDLQTGQQYAGTAQAVTSYNIVSSQYSTLYAENTAREKAAELLAEQVERDILLRLSKPDVAEPAATETPVVDYTEPEELGDLKRHDPFNGDDQPFVIEQTEDE